MKEFNLTGTCIPSKHYMVDITDKLIEIEALIRKGKYFTMNRSRQYGKTTTLAALFRRLKDEFFVIRLSFEGLGDIAFQSDVSFVFTFIQKVTGYMEMIDAPKELIGYWSDCKDYDENYKGSLDAFEYLGRKITGLCKLSQRPILLFVDEVDKVSDNQVFMHFLGMLRNKYLNREEDLDITFQSVILAGVYDIKNLKIKLRPDDERKYNSPWNIAIDFRVDMSFSAKEIGTMLEEYEQEHHTGMDVAAVSEAIYFFTSGYPYLVSKICKWMDSSEEAVWTVELVKRAENDIVKNDENTLFDDLIKNVENHTEFKNMLKNIIFKGMEIPFTTSNEWIKLGATFGILNSDGSKTKVSNIMFETYLYNHFLVEKLLENPELSPIRSRFVVDGKLDMPKILNKFQEIMKAEYRKEDENFVEQQGRLLFLCFLKPIINGTGFYYVEPETRDNTRMDIVVAYGGEEHIIELKIWHGEAYRQQGIRQLEDYMESRHRENGYLISFSFLKNKKYISGFVSDGETSKRIYEVTI